MQFRTFEVGTDKFLERRRRCGDCAKFGLCPYHLNEDLLLGAAEWDTRKLVVVVSTPEGVLHRLSV